MTNEEAKELMINAHRELAIRYRAKNYYAGSDCIACSIAGRIRVDFDANANNCQFCSMYDMQTESCNRFNTYWGNTIQGSIEAIARAEFHDEAIKVLSELNANRFVTWTKDKIKFPELDVIDKLIYNKYYGDT